MRVKQIRLVGVTTHKNTVVDLPETGLVLVTGGNGSGKSSLIEAVSVGAWDEPLRGKPIWSGKQSEIGLSLYDGKEITRKKTGAKKTLAFSIPGVADEKHETTTKAQDALEAAIGSHDVWKRSCVFSSSDAAHFTLAPDSQRKRLLETVLGLERFDVAYDAARAELRQQEHLAVQETNLVDRAKLKRDMLKDRLADEDEKLREEAIDPAELLPLNEDMLDYETAVDGAKAYLERAQDRYDMQREVEAGAARAVDEAARAVQDAEEGVRAGEPRPCPACGAAPAARAPQEAREAARAALAAAQARAAQARAAADLAGAATEGARQKRKAAQADLDDATKKLGEARAALEEMKKRIERQKKAVALRNKVALDLDDAEDELTSQKAKAEYEQARYEELQFAAKALSLSGVRAHLLQEALHGIEQVANTWLARIASSDFELKLSPYTEKASGGAKDSISLEVFGAGGGHGYKAASGGERRRIDVALLLALAEVASSAHGQESSTLFLDELFDALDDEGVTAVCDAVLELAQTRCVVLLAHNDTIKTRLQGAAMHIHVDAGRVVVR